MPDDYCVLWISDLKSDFDWAIQLLFHKFLTLVTVFYQENTLMNFLIVSVL